MKIIQTYYDTPYIGANTNEENLFLMRQISNWRVNVQLFYIIFLSELLAHDRLNY